MKNKLEKHYDVLNAAERINLSIAALARDDKEELSQLQNSCPKFDYNMRDAKYCFGMDKIRLICITYTILCENSNNSISLCIFLISILEDLIAAYEEGFNLVIKDLGNDYKPTKKTIIKKEKELKENQKLIDKIGQCFNERVAELKAIHEAFKSFCEKAGIDYENTCKWVTKPGDFKISDHIDFTDFAIDMELKDKTEKSFLDLWND